MPETPKVLTAAQVQRELLSVISHTGAIGARAAAQCIADSHEVLRAQMEHFGRLASEQHDRDVAEAEALRAQLAHVEAERDAAMNELTECRRNRIGDSEIIGRWMCQAEQAEAALAALRQQIAEVREWLEMENRKLLPAPEWKAMIKTMLALLPSHDREQERGVIKAFVLRYLRAEGFEDCAKAVEAARVLKERER